jgi:hypothetical protein
VHSKIVEKKRPELWQQFVEFRSFLSSELFSPKNAQACAHEQLTPNANSLTCVYSLSSSSATLLGGNCAKIIPI